MLTIGQVALRSGVAPSALALLRVRGPDPADRTDGNQRRYARAVLRRVAVIQAGRAAGIPLASIRDALAAAAGRSRRRRSGTGRSSRAPGGATSRSASRCSSACATTSRRASAAAASRCARAGSSTRSTAPHRPVPARATSSGIGRGPRSPYSGREARAHECLQRRRRRDPDHDPRARAAPARRPPPRRHPRREGSAARVRPELRDGRHLLEQPPPPHAARAHDRRPHAVGEHAPPVLALTHAIRNRVARRGRGRDGAGRGVRDHPARMRHRVHAADARAARTARRRLAARDTRSAATARASSRSPCTWSRSRSPSSSRGRRSRSSWPSRSPGSCPTGASRASSRTRRASRSARSRPRRRA